MIYVRLATAIAANADTFLMPKAEVQKLLKKGEITEITIGVDFGGNGSGHAFVATAKTVRYDSLIVLKSRRYVEGEPDPDNPNRKLTLTPICLPLSFYVLYSQLLLITVLFLRFMQIQPSRYLCVDYIRN